MYREITMQMSDGSEAAIPFNANGATAIRFRSVFGKELLGSIKDIVNAAGADKLLALMKLTGEAEAAGAEDISLEDLDPETLQTFISIAGSGEMSTISELAYIMNRSAVGADMRSLDVEGYLDWLEEFESMEFLTRAMDIIGLYMGNRMTTSSPKKGAAQLTEM